MMAEALKRMMTNLQHNYQQVCRKLWSHQNLETTAPVANNNDNLACTKCGIDFIKENLEFEEDIYQDSHDFADIKSCLFCKSYLLHYWVEVFDDGWQYWIKISQEERNQLLQLGTDKYPKGAIIEFIRNKKGVICRSPTDRYVIESGVASILDGPPW